MTDREDKPLSARDIVNADPRPASERTTTPASETPVAQEPPRSSIEASRSMAEPGHDLLFPSEESTGYRSRWEAIQTGFVDEPRAAVEQADALVSQVVTRLSEVFGRERQALEQQWGRGDNVSTEDLRIALKRYRAFFDRLLSV
jgi:hypothetical protein